MHKKRERERERERGRENRERKKWSQIIFQEGKGRADSSTVTRGRLTFAATRVVEWGSIMMLRLGRLVDWKSCSVFLPMLPLVFFPAC